MTRITSIQYIGLDSNNEAHIISTVTEPRDIWQGHKEALAEAEAKGWTLSRTVERQTVELYDRGAYL